MKRGGKHGRLVGISEEFRTGELESKKPDSESKTVRK